MSNQSSIHTIVEEPEDGNYPSGKNINLTFKNPTETKSERKPDENYGKVLNTSLTDTHFLEGLEASRTSLNLSETRIPVKKPSLSVKEAKSVSLKETKSLSIKEAESRNLKNTKNTGLKEAESLNLEEAKSGSVKASESLNLKDSTSGSLKKMDISNFKEARSRSLKEIDSSKLKVTRSRSLKETESFNLREGESSNLREATSLSLKEGKILNPKETKSKILKEADSSNLREARSVSLKDVDSSNLKESRSKSLKEAESSNLKETKSKSLREGSSTNLRETRSASLKKGNSLNLKEPSSRSLKDVESSNLNEARSKSLRETDSSNLKEAKSVTLKDVESSNIKEAKSKSLRDVDSTNLREAKSVSLNEVDGLNFKESSSRNIKQASSSNLKEAKSVSLNETESQNLRNKRSITLKEGESLDFKEAPRAASIRSLAFKDRKSPRESQSGGLRDAKILSLKETRSLSIKDGKSVTMQEVENVNQAEEEIMKIGNELSLSDVDIPARKNLNDVNTNLFEETKPEISSVASSGAEGDKSVTSIYDDAFNNLENESAVKSTEQPAKPKLIPCIQSKESLDSSITAPQLTDIPPTVQEEENKMPKIVPHIHKDTNAEACEICKYVRVIGGEILHNHAQEPWPKDVRLFQPYEVEQILLPDNANCLAVQTFLKMCNLEYEVDARANAEAMSPTGKVPFIKCGAFIVAELEGIVQFVGSKGISLTQELTTENKSDMRAYMTLINNVLGNAELFICWCDNETYAEVTKPRYGSIYPWPLNHIQAWSKRSDEIKRLKVLGWYHKTLEEVYNDVETCCQALTDRLDGNNFFFGNKPTELEALIFGHFYTILTTPLPNAALANILKNFPKLIDLITRLEKQYFQRVTQH